jgi:hypothetical protein
MIGHIESSSDRTPDPSHRRVRCVASLHDYVQNITLQLEFQIPECTWLAISHDNVSASRWLFLAQLAGT